MDRINISLFIDKIMNRIFPISAYKQAQKSNVEMSENNNYRASSHELIIQGIIDSL